jgi:DNA-directed RNA polymerase subunit RPC12/RpoP
VSPNLLRRGEIDTTETLHGILHSGFPLGVTCRLCFHRALVEPRELSARFGSRMPIAKLKFRCSKCRRRSVDVEKFWSRSSVKRFMRRD